MGTEFTNPVAYPIMELFAETSKTDPILYLLSAGADPTSNVDDLARKKKKITEKVSMGEG